MRFHVPGLPHTITNKNFIHCAFTQKVFKLCKMLTKLGHEVYHYGCEGSNPTCTEHVDVIKDEFRKQFYPDKWHDKQWDYNIEDNCHKIFYKNTIENIKKRLGKHDFLLASWGWGHKPIADAFKNKVLTVEPGIGYKDTFSRYRVFESYNWMSHVYGRGILNESGQRETIENGSYFDAVIPNYFDPDDFDYTPDNKEDYFLYLGRIIKRKGLEIVFEIAKATGIHIKMAGQGKVDIPKSIQGEIIEHVGFADAEKRRSLLSKARGLLMPTIYIEPFGGVSIESMISGTPVICTDWGVFPETIIHGVTGYRCRTLDHFIWAIRNIENLSPKTCREYALRNFSLDRVSAMYQEYFEMVHSLWEKDGWYKINRERSNLSWLEKYYPTETPVSVNNKNIQSLPPEPELIIVPDERDHDFSIDCSWYKKEKNPGISFLVRAKNEEDTIGMALDSLNQLKMPYEVNVILNQCTDNTKREVENRAKEFIHIYEYPFQLGKTGVENMCTPVTSVHSTIWLLNWAMMKGSLSYTMRWDADFIMTSCLAKELDDLVMNKSYDIANISAIFADTGQANTEPYLWSNRLVPRYIRYSLWHLAKFAKDVGRITTLKGKIIHDSPLSKLKKYWNAQPWWVLEKNKEAKNRFEEISSQLKTKNLHARASCPKSDRLAKEIHDIMGIKTSEIPQLEKYALSLT